ADGPRRSDVSLLSAHLVVLPFAERRADRMNRRKVENIESHLRNARQLLLEIAQRAERARKKLVPGAVLRLLAIDFDHHFDLIARCESAIGVALHQIRKIGAL